LPWIELEVLGKCLFMALKDQKKRYSELIKGLPHITHKMLTSQLRELEEEGFMDRKVYLVVPPKVEYGLTKLGIRSIEVVEFIKNYSL
jgi:DNA-binding HxlR family transcriptional regulator